MGGKNGGGRSLIKAMSDDGRQKWRRKVTHPGDE
jgi:hypothetical protein